MHETCGRCGRKLKTQKSIDEGFGPVCKRKIEDAKANDEQMEIEQDQEAENDG